MSKAYAEAFQKALNAVGSGIKEVGAYSGKAAARANGISAAAQSAQGAFNQGSVNNANSISNSNLLSQYAFNSGQAAMANEFSSMMWDKSAEWNEMMWEKQAEFNRQEAQKNRDWQQMMEETKYQRAYKDMEAAGINPILASGGVSVGSGGGSAASVGSPSMSPISGQSASGGVLPGQSASESSYTGQMEYLSGILGLMSAGIAGITSALKCFDQVPNGQDIIINLADVLTDSSNGKAIKQGLKDVGEYFKDRSSWEEKYNYDDKDNAFNRYYNPSSSHWIGKKH